jgi:hypothetical protein
MGYLSAVDMVNHATFDEALLWHLQHNHYPPVHSVFVPVAKEAIALCADGLYGERIEMPNGKVLTAASIMEQLHLGAFLGIEEE